MRPFYLVFFYVCCLFSCKLDAIVVLQYHHISDQTPASTSLSPELFQQHLDYLEENEFQIISLQQFINKLTDNTKLPDKTVLITFDDGYRSIFDIALPKLKEKNYPFTVFVNTQPLNQNLKEFMSWHELSQLIQHGATIANHSVSHSFLNRKQDNETDEAWRHRVTEEILGAQEILENKLGKLPKAFAYPYGEYNFQLKKILKDLGYIAFGQQSGAVGKNLDWQALPRFPFAGIYGELSDFKLKVNSLALPIVSIERTDQHDNLLLDHQLDENTMRPQLKITLEKAFSNLEVNCFLSGYGKIQRQQKDGQLIFKTDVDLPMGRSRFNCTAPSDQHERFYWFSQPWIRGISKE